LLLLRLCLAIALLCFSIPGLSKGSEAIVFAQQLIAAVGGILLLAGLWTPVVGALVALDEAWIAFSLYSPGREDSWIHMFIAMLAASVAMLGPGAWSIDARLFGRQRFDIDRTRGRKSSL
jgi:putative oxidoreductase